VREHPHSGVSPSAHAVSGISPKLHQSGNSDHTKQSTALFRAPTTWTCHLANQRGALSHAQRPGSVYKAAVWSTRDSVLNASLSYSYNGVSIASKISTNWPGSDPASRPLIHPRNQQQAVHRRTSCRSYTRLPAVRTRHETRPVNHQQLLMWGRYPPIDTSPHTCLCGVKPTFHSCARTIYLIKYMQSSLAYAAQWGHSKWHKENFIKSLGA
jgi:hypothetical protein